MREPAQAMDYRTACDGKSMNINIHQSGEMEGLVGLGEEPNHELESGAVESLRLLRLRYNTHKIIYTTPKTDLRSDYLLTRRC